MSVLPDLDELHAAPKTIDSETGSELPARAQEV